MTLEERFEQWKSEQYKDQSTEEKFEFVEHLHYFPKHFKKTYLAGATENGIVWHDLEKDPNDLPKNKRNVWCDYDDGYGKGFYNKDEGGWWIEGHMFCSAINAWCELPTFDKE